MKTIINREAHERLNAEGAAAYHAKGEEVKCPYRPDSLEGTVKRHLWYEGWMTAAQRAVGALPA